MTAPEEWDRERAEVLRAIALLNRDVSELKADFADLPGTFDACTRRLETQIGEYQKRFHDLLVDWGKQCVKIETMKVEFDAMKDRVRDIEKLAPAIKVVMWIGAALGASIVALIWALITGQAKVVF